jgi:hypothetical protein
VSSSVRWRIHVDLLLMALMMLLSRMVAQGRDKVLLKACWRRLMRSWPLRSLSADYSLTANDGPMADFFIERDAVSDLSLQSFDAFLKRIETSTDNRKKAVFAKGQ